MNSEVKGLARLVASPAVLDLIGDAWDTPDTGQPPCDFCRRIVPCECSTTEARAAGDETCMCTCGRCMAPL